MSGTADGIGTGSSQVGGDTLFGGLKKIGSL
jgi:hypothetical protein